MEQISRHEAGKVRRFLKRQARRTDRRRAKRDPQEAPRKRRFRGYTD